MVKLSVCINMIFGEYGFYDRFKAAKEAGAEAVEFWDWAGLDIPRIKSLCEENELKLAAFCVSAKNPEWASDFNNKRLSYRDGADAFVKAVKESIPVANELGVKTLIVTVGNERNDITRYEQHANIVHCLKAAAPILEDADIKLAVEPLNVLCNHRGYFLHDTYEAFAIINEVNSPAVKLLFDIYHQQISSGNIIPSIRDNIDLISHFHVADTPGRNQPGTGELCYRNIFKVISELPYDRYVGLEYHPINASSAETFRSTLELTK